MCLNSGGVGVAGSVKGVEQGFVKPDFCKCHESLSNGTASRSRMVSAHEREKGATPTNEIVERYSARAREIDTFRHKKLCARAVFSGTTPEGRRALKCGQVREARYASTREGDTRRALYRFVKLASS